MIRRWIIWAAVFAIALVAVVCDPRASSEWTQWGGPTRNFMSDAKGLASTWPAGGPKKLWTRALGEGHLSWTPPTLVGTTLYARDRKSIAAFNLGG